MRFNDQVFYEGGNGKAVLLIHGITSGCAQMVPMAKMLNDYGYAVHCVNIAGHGTYPQDLLHTSYEDMITKAEYDYQCLKKDYDTVYVGGLSMGGCLSLAVASLHPDVGGIIPCSAPLRMLPGGFVTDTYPPEQVYFHRDMAGKVDLFKYYHIHYEDIPIRVFQELFNLMDYLKKDGTLEKIVSPALVVQAKNDAMADPESCHYIFEHISSQRKELYNPDEGEHNIVLTEGRHEVFRRAAMFLESL
jgi:carboxylesterase